MILRLYYLARGANQTVQGTVYVNPSLGTSCCHEVELRLRTTITANRITGYEINCSVSANGYLQLVRWDGALGNWRQLNEASTSCVNGDVLSATANGSTITVYKNGVQQFVQTDATYSGGSPGVGFFDNIDANLSNFGFSSFTASDTTSSVIAAALQSIAVAPANPSISPSQTQQFTATGTYSDGSTKNITTTVTWASSNNAVATIGTSTGLATGVTAGTSQIRATLGSVVSPNDTLTVKSITLQSIALAPSTSLISPSKTQQFAATGMYSDGSTKNITTTRDLGLLQQRRRHHRYKHGSRDRYDCRHFADHGNTRQRCAALAVPSPSPRQLCSPSR